MQEQIRNDEAVSRLIYFPQMYDHYRSLIWEIVFQFPGKPCESVIWRKYAPTDDGVHQIGQMVEQMKRSRNPGVRYVGFISAMVREIRAIRTAKGHGFKVVHEPREGRHHAHICYNPADGKGLTKGDRNELKLLLRKKFDDEVTTRLDA